MKKLLLLGLLVESLLLTAQEEKIKWISFEEAVEANETNPKKFIVDVYTNWCGWCKRMDASTFKNPVVVQYINKYFHAVKLNAERMDTIILGEQMFVNEGGRGKRSPHQLAIALLNGKMSYPTIVYLDENVDMIQPLAGYQDAKAIEPVLKYFGENAYKTLDWQSFQKEFVSLIKDSGTPSNRNTTLTTH